jgi:hypothetical protein
MLRFKPSARNKNCLATSTNKEGATAIVAHRLPAT